MKGWKPKRRAVARNELALCGWWSTPVQRVWKRWAYDPVRRCGKISKGLGHALFIQCAHSALPHFYASALHVDTLASPANKAFCIEMLSALTKLANDRHNPAIWLLEQISAGGERIGWEAPMPLPYAQIAERARAALGIRRGPFSENQLSQCAKRLKLYDKNTP